jgi:hypothetical protein
MEQYVVRARMDGEIVRLPQLHDSYEAALASWTKLTTAVLPADGRKPRTAVVLGTTGRWYREATDARPVRIAWFDVRSFEDPAAHHAPVADIRVLLRGTGNRQIDDAARRWGEAHGYHGHEGGWIYRGQPGHAGAIDSPRLTVEARDQLAGICRLTAMQGWGSLRCIALPRGAVVQIDRRFHVTADL